MPGQDAGSAARGMVGYLASQQLSDSLAAAKAELEKAKAEAAVSGEPKAGEARPMTDEEKAQRKQACEMLKNFDMNKALAGAWKETKKALGNAAVDAAKQGATSRLKGLTTAAPPAPNRGLRHWPPAGAPSDGLSTHRRECSGTGGRPCRFGTPGHSR